MKILITGAAGTGKSTVAGALSARGYKGVDIDAETDIGGPVNVRTNEREPVPDPRPADWAVNHRWLWDEPKLHAYLAGWRDDLFLCGFAWNQADCYTVFSKIFVLTLSDEALTHRLITRTNNTYGKHPDELTTALRLNHDLTQPAVAAGAVAIDADRPIDKVVDEILAAAHVS